MSDIDHTPPPPPEVPHHEGPSAEARQWAMSRRQFGRLLCEFQGVQWKFADMRVSCIRSN